MTRWLDTEAVGLLPLEIAARAIVRHATIGYPDTPSGRLLADAYVDANWREQREAMDLAAQMEAFEVVLKEDADVFRALAGR